MVGEDTNLVAHRLSVDPSLIPILGAAGDTRRSRRDTGTAMTIGGFALLGVGLLVGGVMSLSGITPGDCPWEDPQCNRGDSDGTVHTGFAIMLVSLIAGPAIAIPGIVKTARTTQLEEDALDRYRASAIAPRPVAHPASGRGLPVTSPLAIRLFSFAF